MGNNRRLKLEEVIFMIEKWRERNLLQERIKVIIIQCGSHSRCSLLKKLNGNETWKHWIFYSCFKFAGWLGSDKRALQHMCLVSLISVISIVFFKYTEGLKVNISRSLSWILDVYCQWCWDVSDRILTLTKRSIFRTYNLHFVKFRGWLSFLARNAKSLFST